MSSLICSITVIRQCDYNIAMVLQNSFFNHMKMVTRDLATISSLESAVSPIDT